MNIRRLHAEEVLFLVRKVDIRLPGKGNSNSRGARPVYKNHFDDEVDSDQLVVNKALSLSPQAACGGSAVSGEAFHRLDALSWYKKNVIEPSNGRSLSPLLPLSLSHTHTHRQVSLFLPLPQSLSLASSLCVTFSIYPSLALSHSHTRRRHAEEVLFLAKHFTDVVPASLRDSIFKIKGPFEDFLMEQGLRIHLKSLRPRRETVN
jgi:hypothetical protein